MYSLCLHSINYVWRPQNSAPSPKILINVYFCAQVTKYRRLPSFLCKGISGTGILKIGLITWFVIFLLLTLDVGPADVNCIKLMLAGTFIEEDDCWCLVQCTCTCTMYSTCIYRRSALNWLKTVSINCQFKLKNATVWHGWNVDQTQQRVNQSWDLSRPAVV